MTLRFTLKVFAAVARLYQPASRMLTEHGSRVYSTSRPLICAIAVRPGRNPAGAATIRPVRPTTLTRFGRSASFMAAAFAKERMAYSNAAAFTAGGGGFRF